MGLLNTIKNVLSGNTRPSEHYYTRTQNADPYNGVPMGDGDLFVVNQYLQAVSTGSNNITWFTNYLYEKKWWVNQYKIEGNDELNDIFRQLLNSVFDYGKVALTKIGDKWQICGITRIIDNEGEWIKEAEAIAIYPFMGYTANPQQTRLHLTDKNAVFLKWNYESWTMLLVYRGWLANFNQFVNANNTNLYFLSKKFIYNCNNGNSEAIEEEMDSLLSTTPYILRNGFTPNLANKAADNMKANLIEQLPVPPTNQVEFWHAFKETKNMWYSQIGRRINSSFKKERMINSEAEMNEDNFLPLEMEARYYLEIFVRKFNEVFGKSAKLVNIFDVEEKEAEENMLNNEEKPELEGANNDN